MITMDMLDELIPDGGEPSHNSFTWAAVTSITPLTLLFDGDTTPTLGRAAVVNQIPLAVGDRVLVLRNHRRMIVLGSNKAILESTPQRPYAPLPAHLHIDTHGTWGFSGTPAVWYDYPGMSITLPSLPRAMVARIDFEFIANSSTGYLMAGAKVSGATTISSVQREVGGLGRYGSHTPRSGGSMQSNTGWKIVQLNAGINTITLQVLRDIAGTHSADYPGMSITPISWVDDTPTEPAANWGTALPPGTYIEYSGATALDLFVWLPAEGQAVSRTTYANLFNAIGTTYGVGDGSTTFVLPDARGRTLVGLSSDTEFDTLGKKFGTKTHTLTTAEIPAHAHQQKFSLVGAPGSTMGAMASSGSGAQYNAEQTTLNTGGGGAHNNIQPSLVAKIYIKT